MKQLIFSLIPAVWVKYKGARETFERIAIEIATYNGGNASQINNSDDSNKFIEELFEGTNYTLEIKDKAETTFEFGHKKSSNEYVVYGTITKIHIL